MILLHPALNHLPLAAADTLPALDAIAAVEIYNHNLAMAGGPDQAHGAYMLDGLLERGQRLLVNAGDDAHFGHVADRFGGWVEVYAERLEPTLLLDALKAGHFYATQGPALRAVERDGDQVQVRTSAVYAITLTGSGDRWQHAADHASAAGASITAAVFDLTTFRGSYCRVTAVDWNGRRAWSNPIWL